MKRKETQVKVIDLSRHTLLSKDDAILMVIDIQERLLPVIAEKERIVENAVKLIQCAHILELPIILTEQQNLGDTVPQIRKELTGITPITKLSFDCFGSKAFIERIRQLNRKTLILTGIEAHICVAQTALHARAGFTVHVVSDATSSRSLHNVEVALHRMRQHSVTITSTEMVIYELVKEAGTDTFREVLKLVK